MDKKSLLNVLLEVQERFPNAHWHEDPKQTIDSILSQFRRDLRKERLHETDRASAWMGPHYWMTEIDETPNTDALLEIWHDDRPGMPLMLLEQGSWMPEPDLGRGRREK